MQYVNFSFTKTTQNNGNYFSNIIRVSTRSCHFQAVLFKSLNMHYNLHYYIMVKHPVAQLVETLRYKQRGRGFDSRCCQWNFSLTSFRPPCGPGVDSVSNRNEYQEYFLGGKSGRYVRLTTLPLSCDECLELLGASTSFKPQGHPRRVQELLYLLPFTPSQM
jgi:hypothetical protein